MGRVDDERERQDMRREIAEVYEKGISDVRLEQIDVYQANFPESVRYEFFAIRLLLAEVDRLRYAAAKGGLKP